jgi:peptidoglycan/LPS O-acetylase OafA/YrhL
MHPKKHLLYLDGWRGIAILDVLLSHFVPTFYGLGTFGIDLFFVLSGYLIGGLLFIDKIPLGYFFKRRISRIYPAFSFFIIAMAVMVWILPAKQGGYIVPMNELFDTLTFLRTYLPPHNSIWSEMWPIGHIWSLNVEEHSYIWLGLGAMVCRASGKAWSEGLFFLISLAICIFYTLSYSTAHASYGSSPLHTHTECAAFGLLASAGYRLARHRLSFLRKIQLPWLAPMALVAGCFFYSDQEAGVKSLVMTLCLAIAINHAAETYGWILEILSLPIIRWFGLCSFSMYLWQQMFFTPLLRQTPWMKDLWDGLQSGAMAYHLPLARDLPGYFLMATITLIGAFFFYALENPTRNYLNRRWIKKKPNR